MMSTKRKGSYVYVFVNAEDYLTFSLGNRKISGNVAIFNLPAGAGATGTCPQSCPNCYALKAQRAYPSARRARERNLRVLQKHGAGTIAVAVQYLADRHPLKAIRIHEAGDFYSAQYFWDWNIAANILKEYGVPVWTYSKRYTRKDVFSDNLNLVESILPDGSLNFGPYEWVRKKQDQYGLHICPATQRDGKGLICCRDCTICMDHAQVLFVQH